MVGAVSGLDQRSLLDSAAAAAGPLSAEQEAVPRPRDGNAEAQQYGTIVVVGGGCYGSYYVRQLGRARAAGALTWKRVAVVDRDPSCAVGRSLGTGETTTPGVELAITDWDSFFKEYLGSACVDPDAATADAIVPSPLMPHLMFEWILARAKLHWPDRVVETRPVAALAGRAVAAQRAGWHAVRELCGMGVPSQLRRAGHLSQDARSAVVDDAGRRAVLCRGSARRRSAVGRARYLPLYAPGLRRRDVRYRDGGPGRCTHSRSAAARACGPGRRDGVPLSWRLECGYDWRR